VIRSIEMTIALPLQMPLHRIGGAGNDGRSG
jgi:hypothetical protein